MKKYFCFYCQKKVTTYWWPWKRVCTKCGGKIFDDGQRFYKVCDKCKSNLPPDAAVCIKCGYHFSGDNARKVYPKMNKNAANKPSFLALCGYLYLVSMAVVIIFMLLIKLKVLVG